MNNILEYLEASAEKFPDKTAVAYKDEKYTFAELKAAAQSIGTAIRALGITGKPVGVMAERGIETPAYFFGAVYAGNFYVPVDPEMPTAKMQAIFDDAAFPLVLGKIPDGLAYAGAALTLSDVSPADCPIPDTGGDAPLYMVYTSGSTGVPKGVLKSHWAEISFIEAYCATFGFTGREIIGNQTPFYFDASAKDIYMMLRLGCTVEILPSTLFTLPPELIDYLNAKKVTFASWVPTVLSLVAQLNPFSLVKPTTLEKVFFVGEVMPVKHLNKWREALPDMHYVNLYGQSEIAGICAYYEVKETLDNAASLPMGLPLSNCKIYLLDGETVVHEPGRIGEMFIVSDALATEYYHDPEKTEKCFVTRDFGEGPVRCFKTGDLAQYDADGNLVFASRTDFQIKHMGHRIELGEIEAVAGALPEIGRCCCLYNAEKRKLVLFCTLSGGVELKGSEIQSLLRQKLSPYMLPNRVKIMDALPVNANGKIDRQALKALL